MYIYMYFCAIVQAIRDTADIKGKGDFLEHEFSNDEEEENVEEDEREERDGERVGGVSEMCEYMEEDEKHEEIVEGEGHGMIVHILASNTLTFPRA